MNDLEEREKYSSILRFDDVDEGSLVIHEAGDYLC